MRRVDTTALSALVRKTAALATGYADLVRELFMDVRGSYRRELRYARIPSRKWSARQQQRLSRTRKYQE
jgi:hypothetical protein